MGAVSGGGDEQARDLSEGRVILLTSFSHLFTHGFMTLFSAVMVVMAGENAISFLALGIIANIGYFLYGLGGFPAGYLADRYGAKRVLTVGALGMSCSSLLVGLSQGLWSFGVAYALLGLFASIHHPAGLSFIARRVERRGRAMGIHGVLGNLGLFLTPMTAAGCIWLFASWRAAYLVYGLAGLVFAVTLYRSRIPGELDLSLSALRRGGEGTAQGGGLAAALGEMRAGVVSIMSPTMALLFLGSFLSGFIFRGSLTFFPALFRQEVHFITNHDYPVVMAGYLTSAVLSFGLIGAWFGGWINDRIKWPELFPSVIFLLVTPIFYLLSRYTDAKLIVAACLFSLIYYAWQPCQNFLIAKYSRRGSSGIGFGINFFLLFGVGSVATSAGGYMADDFGVDRFYWLMSMVSLAALAASLLVYVTRPRSRRASAV